MGARGSGRGGRLALKWLALAVLGLFLLLRRGGPAPVGYTHTSFVAVEGTQFVLDCRPFYIAGFNVETLAEVVRSDLLQAAATGRGSGRSQVRALFKQAAAAGLNTARTFAHTTDPRRPLQVEPGVYDETVFRSLDVVIAEAERAGLRVILSLADNWKYKGGVDEYLDWSDTVPARDPRFPVTVDESGDFSDEGFTPERRAYENQRKAAFFRDEGARKLYRDHVRQVLERVNSVTGRRYRDDPTILAFNLLNELRCSAYETPECAGLVSKWVGEVAQHFKSLDQRHLLTLGSEGFWGERDAMRDFNPGAPESDWASKSGQDWVAHHHLPQIDFASFHLWSDNWKNPNATFYRRWIEKHAEDCKTALKKPCLLEEFGKKLEPQGKSEVPAASAIAKLRDPLYSSVLEAVEGGIGRRDGLGGSLYWRWGLDAHHPNRPGEYGVLPGHSTFQLITQHAQRVRAHMLSEAPQHQCPLDCWTPAAGTLGGLLRRCEHHPSVCDDHRARQRYQQPSEQLQASGRPVFTSQEACCLPGLGAFRDGCTTTWF